MAYTNSIKRTNDEFALRHRAGPYKDWHETDLIHSSLLVLV